MSEPGDSRDAIETRDVASERIATIDAVAAGLEAAGYVTDRAIATAVFLAHRLRKPILVEGPAGVGKTELAKATAAFLDLPLVRLRCYDGLDEAKALYEWKYGKQLLYTQILRDRLGDELHDAPTLGAAMARLHAVEDVFFAPEFLAARPLLRALQEPCGAVLLVDEIDKSDQEFEAFLLELLSDYQVTVPELGTIVATVAPLVILTSNDTRDLGDALKRRCLHLHVGYPDAEREGKILDARVPGIDARLRDHLVAFVQRLRTLELRKSPSISETIDWAKTILLLHVEELDAIAARETLGVLLKYESDIEATAKQIDSLVREPILDFLRVARTAGLGIVPGDALDVFHALDITGYADRETQHAALRMLLARSNDERARFDDVFARFFGEAAPLAGVGDGADAAASDFDIPEIAEAIAKSALARTLVTDDRAQLVRDLHAAARDANLATIRLFTQTGIFTQRILDALDLPALGNAIGRLRSSGDPRQVRAAEFLEQRERAVRELARDLVERRLAKRRETAARERDDFLRDARLNNIETRDRERMRELVRAMAKRLATRRGRMRRERRGELDVRRTVRANVAHDGVLLETVMRERKIERPRLVVLCDVSGSVAALSEFCCCSCIRSARKSRRFVRSRSPDRSSRSPRSCGARR